MMIDWDNAPEGATHVSWDGCTTIWYRKTVDMWEVYHSDDGAWNPSFNIEEWLTTLTPRPTEPTPYTRDEALQFLVDNLDEWPTVIDDAPLCAGWGWFSGDYTHPIFTNGNEMESIGRNEWLEAQGLSQSQQDPATAEQGVKYDTGKPIIGAIPPHAELAVARVMTFGAQKYARDNWRKIDDIPTRYMDAALRHLNAIRRGETVDPESGEHHLAHAACCIMFMLDVEEQSGNDNPQTER